MPISDAQVEAAEAAYRECLFSSGRSGEAMRRALEAAEAAEAATTPGAPDPVFIEAMATEYTRLAWSSAPLSTWPAGDRDLIIDRFRQSYLAGRAALQAPDA